MFKNKTYRQRFQIYALGACLLLAIMYQFSFSKTLAEVGTCHLLEKKLASIVHAPRQIKEIQLELDRFSKSLNFYGENSERFHEHLLNIVSSYCSKNSVQLVEFPRQHSFNENDIEIATSQFTVQGEFVPMLRLIYLLEQQQPAGRICNLRFFKNKNNKTKRMQLFMHVMVQNITSK